MRTDFDSHRPAGLLRFFRRRSWFLLSHTLKLVGFQDLRHKSENDSFALVRTRNWNRFSTFPDSLLSNHRLGRARSSPAHKKRRSQNTSESIAHPQAKKKARSDASRYFRTCLRRLREPAHRATLRSAGFSGSFVRFPRELLPTWDSAGSVLAQPVAKSRP
jgi:hypothetical protein